MLIIPIPKSASSSLEYTLRNLHNFDRRKLIRKHIYPSKENLDNLKSKKKIILLRDPNECRRAILRARKSLIIEKGDDSWLNYDYEGFYEGWINNLDENSLLIWYNELIENPEETINKIEEFYGLKKSKKVKLFKINYSRKGKLKRAIFIQLKKIKLLREIRNRYFSEKLKLITMI